MKRTLQKRLAGFMQLGLFALCLMFTSASYAQYTGTVLDGDTDEPLIGATILISGTSTGTITDFDGKFSIDAKEGDVLDISYTGYSPQKITVGAEKNLAIRLGQGLLIDEVVVTGYAVETKRQTTGAVSTVSAEELSAIPSGNIEQQLQGRVAGVTVITNGQPGTTSQIRVRGFGAFGGNEPLYVIDGVPVGSTDFLNPDDIESTTVLKDAAAASIYGARAANGVVVYTTKQGSRKKQKLKVTYNGLIGYTDPNVNGSPEMLDPQQMADWTHRAYENNAAANGTAVEYTHPQYGSNATPVIPAYLHATGQGGQNGLSEGDVNRSEVEDLFKADPENTFLIRPNLAGTNWYDEITRNAPIHRHSLGFQGGTDRGRYYFGLGMQQQSGILLENEFSRYSFRANTEFDLTKWLAVGQNLQFTRRAVTGQQGDGGGAGVADDESEVLSAYRMPTIIPVFDEFGSYASTKAGGFNNPRNPVRRLVRNNGDDGGFNYNAFGNVYLAVTPVEGLTLKSSVGGQYDNFYFTNYGFRYFGDSEPEASNTFSEGSGYIFRWVWTNTASYKIQAGDHGVTLLGGIESLNTGAGRNLSGSGINPFSTDLDFQNLSTVSNPQVGSSLFSGVNFYSVFGKVDYNFQEKYYLTGVLRRDGSSRFGANSRFGTFPAVSAAWRVTGENFASDISWLSDMKVRVGWGQMGNSNNVNPNNQYSLARADRGNTFYPISGQANGVDEGFAASRIGNPDAKWETSESLNIGFDAGLFNNKIEIALDWWKKDTRELLYRVPLAGVSGNFAEAPAQNVGSMLNQGLDVQIVNRGNITSDLKYTITLNNSFLRNEIIELSEGIEFFDGGSYRGISPIRNAVGQPLSSFFGYQVEGYFSSDADVAAHATQDGAGVGRFKYADINSTDPETGEVIEGVPDGAITPADRTFIGNPVPDYTGGAVIELDYKQFGLEMYWYASVGNEVFNMSKWYTDFFGTFEGSAKGVRALESWTPELGDNASAPIWESASTLSTSGAANSWYVEDGSYLRLQRIGVTYDLANDLVDKMGIGSLTVGIAANNIITFTKYSGLDPGVGGAADTNFGIDVGNYPVTPSYMFNVSVGF